MVLSHSMWMLGIEPRTTARAASGFNHGDISPSQIHFIFKQLHGILLHKCARLYPTPVLYCELLMFCCYNCNGAMSETDDPLIAEEQLETIAVCLCLKP